MNKPSVPISEATSTLNKRRWFYVILILIGAIVNYLDRSNLSVANTTIAAEFGLTPVEMGLLMSAFLWPYAIANLPAGWLVDKLGAKKLFGSAVALWSLVTCLLPFVGYKAFYGLRVLLGIAESPFFPAATKSISTWFTKENRGTPLAVINTGSQIANGIALPLLTALLLSFSWRGMFLIIGVLGFVVAAVWFMVYRDPNAKELIALAEEEGIQAEEAVVTKNIGWGELFKYPSTWYMIIGNFGLVYTMWTYLTWLPGYLVAERGLTLLKMGWIGAIPFMAGIVAVPLGGMISDYFIRQRGFKPINARKVPLVLGALIAACAVAPVPYVSDISLCIFLLAVGYFFSSLCTGVIWTLATDVAPKSMVASLGSIQNFGGFLGAALAPVVTGYIVQMTGSFEYVFVIGAVLLIVSAISYGVFLQKPIQPNINE